MKNFSLVYSYILYKYCISFYLSSSRSFRQSTHTPGTISLIEWKIVFHQCGCDLSSHNLNRLDETRFLKMWSRLTKLHFERSFSPQNLFLPPFFCSPAENWTQWRGEGRRATERSGNETSKRRCKDDDSASRWFSRRESSNCAKYFICFLSLDCSQTPETGNLFFSLFSFVALVVDRRATSHFERSEAGFQCDFFPHALNMSLSNLSNGIVDGK